MDVPTTSTESTTDPTTTTHEKTNEEILHDVATTFWLIFIFYVFASVAWIAYCIISYRRDLEKLKVTAEKNGIARYLELRRLLKAYDSKFPDAWLR
nr:Protein F59B10.6 [Haemonchus contortus]